MTRRSEPKKQEQSFLYRSLVLGTFLIAGCFLVSAADGSSQSKRRRLAKQLDTLLEQKRHHDRVPHDDAKHVQYNPPSPYKASKWTLDEFIVNGVNLAKYGFEGDSPAQVALDEKFELYDNFSLEDYLKAGEDHHTVFHMIMFHRHLEHPSLAFYYDKIAQKEYHKAIGIPVPENHVMKYQKQFNNHDSDVAAIRDLLPGQTDFVVKPTHKKGKAILVSFDEETKAHKMGSDTESLKYDYSPGQIANLMAQSVVKTKLHFLDPWAGTYIPPGIVIEDRFTAFDSHLRAPMELSVYVIWGRVWMAYWHHAEGVKHPGMVFRNGTVVMDDGKRIKIPRWTQWEQIVEMSEDLSSHKDIYQINFQIGVEAGTSRLLKKASRERQMEEVKVVVSEVMCSPDVIKLQYDGLVEELGRLWLAGYQMKIFETIHNDESSHYHYES